MVKFVSVPRITSLGLRGADVASSKILDGSVFETILVRNENITEDENAIYRFAKSALKEKCFFVGGDHSITLPIGKAFGKKHGFENSIMIIFDAHADCMPPMQEPTHEEFVAGLVREGWNPENIIIVGLRKIEPEEKKYLNENGVKYFRRNQSSKWVLDYLRNRITDEKVYVSVDIDAINPEVAPGVHYPEEKGLSRKKFFEIYDAIFEFDVRCVDLVEIVEAKDVDGKTVALAREILSSAKL